MQRHPQLHRSIIVIWVVFSLLLQPVHAQTVPTSEPVTPAGLIDRLKDLLDLYKAGKEALKPYQEAKKQQKFFDNLQKCIKLHGNADRCAAVLLWCDFQDKAISQVYKGWLFWVSKLKVFDAFKLYCGTGTCYQCCLVPGSGCHTSFQGYPVINCNPIYGPGTRRAGDTLIVDPNVQPGAACLTTPQICDHLAACRDGGVTAAVFPLLNLDAIPQNTNEEGDPLTWTRAINQRGMNFAKDIDLYWGKYLDEFTTDKHSLDELFDFVTGRGCQGWRTNISGDAIFDWENQLFAIKDTQGNILEGVSHLNGLHQLGTLRILASIPNVDKRLAYVDSRLWTKAEKAAYLAQVGDPDQALLRAMSPIALEILTHTTTIQDYRLLSIPLPDETPDRLFNGCQLGIPPHLSLSLNQATNQTVQITLKAEQLDGSAVPYPFLMDWGDGQVDQLTYPPAAVNQTISHTYARAGKYLIGAVLQNESGLHGYAGLVVETANDAQSKQQGDQTSAAVIPAIAKVTLEQPQINALTLSGNEQNFYFDLALQTVQSQTVALGLSNYQTVKFNAFTDFRNFTVDNPTRVPLNSLVITPTAIGGFYIGLNEVYLTTPRLVFSIDLLAAQAPITVSVPLTTSMVKVYAQDPTMQLPADLVGVDAEGRLKIPLVKNISNGTFYLKQVEIPFNPAWFQNFSIPPLDATFTPGESISWLETQPDALRIYQQINFPAPGVHTYGENPFPMPLTASSGLTVTTQSATLTICTSQGQIVTLLAAGLCTIVATQPGNDTYAAAQTISQTFTIQPAQQTITFVALPNRSLSDSAFAVTATSSSGLPVEISSKTPIVCSAQKDQTATGSTYQITLLALGQCTLVAAQSGNSNYQPAAAVEQSFQIQNKLFLPSIMR